MAKSKSGLTKKSARPFGWVALIWGFAASVAVGIASDDPVSGLKWMIGLWALCLLDLAALALLVEAVLKLSSDLKPAQKPAWTIQAFFWGTTKLACIAA